MNKFNLLYENILGGLARLGADAIKKNQGDTIYPDIKIPKNNNKDNQDSQQDDNNKPKNNKPQQDDKFLETIKIDMNTDWNDLTVKLKKYKYFSIFIDKNKQIFPDLDEKSLLNGKHQPQTTKTFIAELNPKDQKTYVVISQANPKTGKQNDLIVNRTASNQRKIKFLLGFQTFYDTIIIHKNFNNPNV